MANGIINTLILTAIVVSIGTLHGLSLSMIFGTTLILKVLSIAALIIAGFKLS